MSRTARFALVLALIIPLICYFIVKMVSERTARVPPKFFPDTVIIDTIKGKLHTDTQWHRIPDFTFTNQLGRRVSLSELTYMKDDDMLNKIVVADFFFTRCPTICPTLTRNMRKLQESITNAQRVGNTQPDFIHFISFSVDPERDSVPALKKWADRFQVNPEMWWLLTGDKKEIYNLSINEMRLAAVDGKGVDTSFIHTDRFVLIDRNRIIRGLYSGLDSADLARLSEDIVLLSLEKDKNRRSFLEGKLELIAIVFLLALVGLGLFLYIIRKK